jgi:hypothetical protein
MFRAMAGAGKRRGWRSRNAGTLQAPHASFQNSNSLPPISFGAMTRYRSFGLSEGSSRASTLPLH